MIGSVLQQPHVFLVLSVLLLGSGPLLYRWLDRVRGAKAALDGFVLIGIGGFVLLHVMPEAVDRAGIWAILVALLGVVAPMLLGRLQRFSEKKAHIASMWLAVFGLVFHGLLDGMALHTTASGSHGTSAAALAMAVLLHRLPVSLMIWNWGHPIVGRRRVIAILVSLGVVTVIGYFLGGLVAKAPEGGFGLALFQALVAGALMHVLLHRHDDTCSHGAGWQWAEMSGAMIGVGLLLAFPNLFGGHVGHIHQGHQHVVSLAGYGHRFLELALTSAPALLFGYLLAGGLSSFLSQAPLQWLHRGSPLQQASRGLLFGLPLPICSCGVVPVYQSLVKRGVPATAAMAFLVATPELGVESIILSFPLLGVEMTMVRLGCAGLLALAVGWWVGRMIHVDAPPTGSSGEDVEAPPLKDRLRNALRVGLGDIVGDTAAWILVGLAVAAMLQPSAIQPMLKHLPAGADVLLFATLGVPFYVCASGATPLAAALIFSGVSPGAAIAFLLAGPATNVTTFGVLSQLHGLRAAVAFGVAMLLGAIGLGFGANWLLGAYQVPYAKASHHHGDPLHWLSLGILCLAFFLAILRQGPIAFIWSIFASGDHGHDHDHDHGHDHSHDHDHDHDHSHDHGHDHDHSHDHDDEPPASAGGSCCSAKIK